MNPIGKKFIMGNERYFVEPYKVLMLLTTNDRQNRQKSAIKCILYSVGEWDNYEA